MEDITELFLNILEQSNSIEIAEADFRRLLVDEPELRRAYREYCRENGVPEKHGFTDFCQRHIDARNDIWNSLNDYNDE